VRFYTENSRFAFSSLSIGGGGLGATYDDHVGLIEKRVVDFLLVLIELFSIGVTAEALRANIGLKSAIPFQRLPDNPKFQIEGVAPTKHSFSGKTNLNGYLYGVNIWTDLFFRFVTMHAFDRRTNRQTDGQTSFSSLVCAGIPYSAEKCNVHVYSRLANFVVSLCRTYRTS